MPRPAAPAAATAAPYHTAIQVATFNIGAQVDEMYAEGTKKGNDFKEKLRGDVRLTSKVLVVASFFFV